jgi:hypothetical protein
MSACVTVYEYVNVTVAPGANVVHIPSLADESGDAAAPSGPGVVNVSPVIPAPPVGTTTAGTPCRSLI